VHLFSWGKVWTADSQGFVCKNELLGDGGGCKSLKTETATNANQQGIIGDVHTNEVKENSEVAKEEAGEIEIQHEALAHDLHGPMACATCSAEFQCCIEYEFCISCCLKHLQHGKDGKEDDTIDPEVCRPAGVGDGQTNIWLHRMTWFRYTNAVF